MNYKEVIRLLDECEITLLDPQEYGDSEYRCTIMRNHLKEAAGKEIKRAVIRVPSSSGDPAKDQYRCPVCGRRLRCTARDPYCPACGQAIEWALDGRYL